MRILAVDPGETIGYIVIETHWPRPILLQSWQEPVASVSTASLKFLMHLRKVRPDVVVIEDYRIFADKAAQHIGKALFTAKLLGAFEAVGACTIPPVSMTLVQPSKKGRWPEARLKAKFPEWVDVPRPHGLDALKLALVHLEEHDETFP